MEHKRCGICGYRFSQPLSRFETGGPCPRCGDAEHRSSGSEVATVDTKVTLLRKIGAKRKRWAVEETMRHEVRGDLGHPVGRHTVIDRRENLYYERVVDKVTGKEIRLVTEPLTTHRGRGGARSGFEFAK